MHQAVRMFGLVVFIFIGLIVGIIARALVPGHNPGIAITALLGMAAQSAVSIGARWIGATVAQPWSFLLSIAAAAVLLQAFREAGLDELLPRRPSQPTAASPTPSPRDASDARAPLGRVIVAAVGWSAFAALLLGVTGFIIGFFGPMVFQPWSNQGPMVGIFVTGPAGLLLGALLGGALKILRPRWRTSWYAWTLSAVSVAHALVVFDLVADRSWWR